jgi:hypothetical protein
VREGKGEVAFVAERCRDGFSVELVGAEEG